MRPKTRRKISWIILVLAVAMLGFDLGIGNYHGTAYALVAVASSGYYLVTSRRRR